MAEDVSLKEYFERILAEKDAAYAQRFEAQEKAVEAALIAQKEAVQKAETAAEKRFDCVAADTPILCADLIWRPAGELMEGDELVAFDEESLTRRGRMYRRAVVTHNAIESDALLLVTTPKGSVRCNKNHPWMVRRPRDTKTGTANGIWEWVKTNELKVGDEVLSPVDVWTVDRTWESGWLAGMFDGEGCLCISKNGGAQLSVTQRESKTADALAKSLSGRIESFVTHYRKKGQEHWQQQLHFIISARCDIMKVLGSIRPPRLIPKSDGVWEDKPIGGKNRRTTISEIRGAGTGEIAMLSTSTKTYIAAGFAMHNSVNEFRAQLSDQATTFMPRREAESAMRAMTEKYEQLAKTNADNIDALERRQDRNEGRSSGLGAGWGYLVGGIGVVGAVIGIIFGFMNAKVERNAAWLEQSIPVPVSAPAPLPVKEQH